jgi:hypothetical protein
VEEFAARQDGGDQAGHRVVAPRQASDFGRKARPDARAEPAEPLAIEARVQPHAFGDGQHDLLVRDGRADLLGHVNRGQQIRDEIRAGPQASPRPSR